MGQTIRLLIIEDSEDDTLLLVRELKRHGYHPVFERVETAEAMHAALTHQSWDVIIADYVLPHFSAPDALRVLKSFALDVPFIVVSGVIGEETAVAAMKAGAHDYLMKGNLQRLVPAVEREVRESLLRQRHREIEQSLQTSEMRHRAISELVSDFAYALRLEPDGRVALEWITDAMSRITGYPNDILQRGDMLYQLVHPDDTDVVARSYERVMHGLSDVTEFRIVTKTGDIRWLRAHAQPIWDAVEQRLVRIYGAAQDITDRKQTEVILRKERDFNTAILETSGALIVVLDDQGCIVRFNRACEELSGYRGDEVCGLSLFEILIPDDERQAVQTIFDDLQAGHYPNQYEGDWVTRAGDHRRIAWSNTIILDSLGDVEYIISTGLDLTERRQVEQRIYRQLQQLTSLRRIQTVINTSLDLYATLNLLLEQVNDLLGVDASAVLLLTPDGQTLEFAIGRGFRFSSMQWSYLPLGEGYAGQAALQRRSMSIPDITASKQRCVRANLLKKEAFVTYYGIPMIAQGKVKGVLELFHRSPMTFDQEWLNFIEALVGHAAVVIDNTELVDSLKRSKEALQQSKEQLQQSQEELIHAYDATIEGWARALELRDAETEGHSRRVIDMTMKLARAMGLSKEQLIHIRRGTILHDIGKMGIPDHILLKPGALTDQERAIMQRHPVYAYRMLAPIIFLRPALDIPYCHHERWDGSGYPQGSKGEEIPLTARIFAVVDVWDALRSDRPYRKGWSDKRVQEYIHKNAGTQFDPQVVAAFLNMVTQDESALQKPPVSKKKL
jgi:PAS domain S-box-containing protein